MLILCLSYFNTTVSVRPPGHLGSMSNYILGRSIHEQTDRIFNLASESIADLKNAMSQRLCYRSLGSSAAESSLCIISRAGGTVRVHQSFGQK